MGGTPNWDDVVAIATALPEVEVTTSYGTPALKVKGKLFARLRDEAEGGVMLRCSAEEKEALLASGDPAFSTTPHYDGYDSILVDLARVDEEQLRELVEEAWRGRAPVLVRKAWEGREHWRGQVPAGAPGGQAALTASVRMWAGGPPPRR